MTELPTSTTRKLGLVIDLDTCVGCHACVVSCKGAWALSEDAPEAKKGFLLNHLIHELQPPKGDGLRWSNSDSITGQAAWFDLRVKIEKVAAPAEAQPAMDPIKSPVGNGPGKLAWKVGG